MIEWIPVAGGDVRLGLRSDEAERIATAAAALARAEFAEQQSELHAEREARELEEMWGNPDYLLEQLAFSLPTHTVQLADYLILKRPVTRGDWQAFELATDAPAPEQWPGRPVDDSAPIVGVSWEEARAYAEWRGAALPSEAQWERAARGDARDLAWGESWLGESLSGLIRSSGELYEWCDDEFGPYPGADQMACDRIAPPPGGWWGTRSRRGGGLPGIRPTSVMRRGADPTVRLRDTTFRLVKSA